MHAGPIALPYNTYTVNKSAQKSTPYIERPSHLESGEHCLCIILSRTGFLSLPALVLQRRRLIQQFQIQQRLQVDEGGEVYRSFWLNNQLLLIKTFVYLPLLRILQMFLFFTDLWFPLYTKNGEKWNLLPFYDNKKK